MQDWIDHHPTAFLILFPFYFVALWLLVSAIISYVGGWTTLARHFRTRTPVQGSVYKMQSGQMRWLAGYHNCLTLGSSPEGFYLAMMWLFRFRHPPLFIPWSEVTIKKRQFLFLTFVRLGFGRELDIPLLLRPGIAEKLKRDAMGGWPVELI